MRAERATNLVMQFYVTSGVACLFWAPGEDLQMPALLHTKAACQVRHARLPALAALTCIAMELTSSCARGCSWALSASALTAPLQAEMAAAVLRASCSSASLPCAPAARAAGSALLAVMVWPSTSAT